MPFDYDSGKDFFPSCSRCKADLELVRFNDGTSKMMCPDCPPKDDASSAQVPSNTVQSPRDRARDAHRQYRLTVPLDRRFPGAYPSGPGLTGGEENSIPFSISPFGSMISDNRQTLRDYADVYTAEDRAKMMSHVKGLKGMAPEARQRPLKDI